jgi:hypothetical protein
MEKMVRILHEGVPFDNYVDGICGVFVDVG